MIKCFGNLIFLGPNDETLPLDYSHGLNSILDFFLNYWSKKDRLSRFFKNLTPESRNFSFLEKTERLWEKNQAF